MGKNYITLASGWGYSALACAFAAAGLRALIALRSSNVINNSSSAVVVALTFAHFPFDSLTRKHA